MPETSLDRSSMRHWAHGKALKQTEDATPETGHERGRRYGHQSCYGGVQESPRRSARSPWWSEGRAGESGEADAETPGRHCNEGGGGSLGEEARLAAALFGLGGRQLPYCRRNLSQNLLTLRTRKLSQARGGVPWRRLCALGSTLGALRMRGVPRGNGPLATDSCDIPAFLLLQPLESGIHSAIERLRLVRESAP